MAIRPFNPVSTYRIQFHKDFRFAELRAIIPYLQQLGVRTIYASPVFRAVAGSTHGYDVTDANTINPEIGSLEELYELSRLLKQVGMSWIQDIVPNHMGLHPDNPWIRDVLQKGKLSAYAHHFDIDWEHPEYGQKLGLPVLDSSLQDALERGTVYLSLGSSGPQLNCGAYALPVSGKSIAMLMEVLDVSVAAFQENAEPVRQRVKQLNEDKVFIIEFIDAQRYRLCHWQETDNKINYRRFFTINGLIGLQMQSEGVFREYHQLIARLCAEGVFDGLRVDHIDGLADPSGYLYRLRNLVGEHIYICIEKILQSGEQLPRQWPVQGTTGYDFLAVVNNLFTDPEQKVRWSSFYQRLSGIGDHPEEIAIRKKRFILEQYMQGELHNLCNQVKHDFPEQMSISDDELKRAISALLVYCPVYKFYPTRFPLSEKHRRELTFIIDRAESSGTVPARGIAWLRSFFLDVDDDSSEGYKERLLHFYQRCMQFTGPLMAKGVEDTLMYSYHRFVVHNEVGDEPGAFGITTDTFHRRMQQRQSASPLALNATATHDTKRGEDARARLNALTGNSDQWFAFVRQWLPEADSEEMPDRNDGYLVLQTLVATFPSDGNITDEYRSRLEEYLRKALREAKEHSSWSEPDESYEQRVIAFACTLTDNSVFCAAMNGLLLTISDAAIINALQQLVLKFTCPGIPDIYQGNELWDLSMVDPDNRRPVDYGLRNAMMQTFLSEPDICVSLDRAWHQRDSGAIKLLFTRQLLTLRNSDPSLFSEGDYRPLTVTGRYRNHILAFCRVYQHRFVVVVLGLHCQQLARAQGCSVAGINWADTCVSLPLNGGNSWRDLTGRHRSSSAGAFRVSDLFGQLPLALIHSSVAVQKRSCGVLLPVFSLPSEFGIGDFGPGAHHFIRFLEASGQRYWQMLPLNPVQQAQHFSPYSSCSSMALNPLLISPELLYTEGLLDQADLDQHRVQHNRMIDYVACEDLKWRLLQKAYARFKAMRYSHLELSFASFCKEQDWWLQDYALFTLLGELHQHTPWYEWPEALRNRDMESIRKIAAEHTARLEEIKWVQFIADHQWSQLRQRCAVSGIRLIGDLPFYLNHNAAEVWASPHLFRLDEASRIKAVAGVPPDYFSSTGQLWNMPTYDWDALRKENYSWWIKRLKRNTAQFDLLRLDHFRAFESFWEVPAGSDTAINGHWIKGPGTDFFRVVAQELGHLPFIAEDLGEEMDAVYAFRAQVGLPGMKVLQFAWGKGMPRSVDVPHQYTHDCIVYTGTHDNNTTRGWFTGEADAMSRLRLEAYTGKDITEYNVCRELLRMAYASVADIAIVPVQDLLNLHSSWRINIPGSDQGNWRIRFATTVFGKRLAKELRLLAALYNRV